VARTDGNGNLKRGQLRPQPHGGALAPPPPGGRAENFTKAREDEQATKQRVLDDPGAALEEIHAELTLWTKKIVRRGAREGKPPDSATMNVIREFRQTQEAVNEARRAKGAILEAQEFFESLDVRVADAVEKVGAVSPVAEA